LDTLIFGQNLSKTKIFFYFCLILSGGFIFRYIFFPYEIPLVLDSLLYFWYGIDLSVSGNFPVAGATVNANPLSTNNLWPTFLSLFFSILDSDNYLDFMFMQRNLSIFFSVMTAIPIYFLAKRFFRREIALIAPLFFIFEPRIVGNSMLGITEPMFVFFVVSTLALFFSDQKKMILSSFVLAGIFCLVRYEGLMMLIPMVIIMFFRFKGKKNRLIYPIIGLCIFLLVITPMSVIKIETMGYDGIFSHVGAGIEVATQNNFLNQDVDKQKFFPHLGLINLLKLFGWILIPSFFTFLPIGIFFFFKNRENKKIELIIIGLFALIPAFYAFSRGAYDVRYLFVIYPVLIIISLFAIEFVSKKIERKNLFYLIIIIGIIITSFVFLSYKDDNEHQREAYQIALETKDLFTTINGHHPEDAYYRITILNDVEKFPSSFESIDTHMNILEMNNEKGLEYYIKENRSNGLTHLRIDNSQNRPYFFNDILENEHEFSYLKKIYDSSEKKYRYDVKIFEINYKEFDKIYPIE